MALTIREEGEDTKADVFLSQSPGAMGVLAGTGLLRPVDPALMGRLVDPTNAAPDGSWVGLSGRKRVLAYNTDVLTDAELPDSVLEITAGRFDGPPGGGPDQRLLPGLRHRHAGDARRGPHPSVAGRRRGQRGPHLRQQRRHPGGDRPGRDRRGPGQPLLRLPQAGRGPGQPGGQPQLRRWRRRVAAAGDLGRADRPGRRGQSPSGPTAWSTTCSPNRPSATSPTRRSSTPWSRASRPRPACPPSRACAPSRSTPPRLRAASRARWRSSGRRGSPHDRLATCESASAAHVRLLVADCVPLVTGLAALTPPAACGPADR